MTIKSAPRCFKCGAILQSEDVFSSGYIDAALLAKKTHRPLFCDKCFAQISLSEEPAKPSADAEFLTMLEDARATDALIAYFVDLFSFECSFADEVTQLIKKLPIVVIATKRDFLPRKWDDGALCEYVAKRFNEAGFTRVVPSDVHLASYENENAQAVGDLLLERRQGHDVYLIGAKQSGKSRFLSAFLSTRHNHTNRPISSGPYHGTHLRVMSVPLDASSSLYDTPGLSADNSLYTKANAPKEIVVEGEIAPRKCLLMEKGSLFIGLLARFDVVKLSSKYVVAQAFFAPKTQLKPVLPKENMDALMDKYLEKKAMKPRLLNLHSSKDFDAYEFSIESDGLRDFGVAGLGFLTINAKAGDVYRLYAPKGIGVYSALSKAVTKKRGAER